MHIDKYINNLGLTILTFIDGKIGKIVIAKRCCINNHVYAIQINAKSFKSWTNGLNIQEAFPKLDSEEIEFLSSGLTPLEFEKALE